MTGYDYFYTLQEICVLLNLLPNSFRQIAREYSDVVRPSEEIRKGRPVVGLPRAEFEVLRQIVEMRARGVGPEEIRRRLGVRQSVPAPVASPLVADPPEREAEEPVDDDQPGTSGDAEPTGAEPASTGEDARGPEDELEAPGDPLDSAVEETATGPDESAAGPDEPTPDPDEPSASGDAPQAPEEGPAALGDGSEGPADADLLVEEAAAAREPRLSPDRPEDAPVLEASLLAELASLREELLKMDERRREERDKLLTALMRTQHELQSLRYEVGASLSRRERKKKRGFWAWLLDL